LLIKTAAGGVVYAAMIYMLNVANIRQLVR